MEKELLDRLLKAYDDFVQAATPEISGRDSVALLGHLLKDRREAERLELERLKFEFVKTHTNLLPPENMGPQGIGRRLLEHDDSNSAQSG